MGFEREGRNTRHDQISGLTGGPAEMRGPAQTEAHKIRREKLNTGIHRIGALSEPKVRVIEGDEMDQADETVERPDEERGQEPVGDPGGECRRAKHEEVIGDHLPRLLDVHVSTSEKKTTDADFSNDVHGAGSVRTEP